MNLSVRQFEMLHLCTRQVLSRWLSRVKHPEDRLEEKMRASPEERLKRQ